MEKKKALLVVVGRRAVPDVLVLFWVKPQLVRVIRSKEGWEYEQSFIDIAKSMGCEVDVQHSDAYDLNASLQACRNACELYPDTEWDWIFSIGSSPKVTGIAAYEVAKERGISCWHVDAQRDRVVSLIKPVPVDTEKFFHLTLTDYMQIQHRIWGLKKGLTDRYRDSVKKWSGVAKELAISPNARELLNLLYAKNKDKDKDHKAGLDFVIPSSLAISPLVTLLEDEGLLKASRDKASDTKYSFASQEAAQFIGTGDWLEFYVWHATISTGLADEQHCQWGCEVKDGLVDKEFDLMFMYKAQLIVAECKSERDLFRRDAKQNPFKEMKEYLGDFEAKANVLGGSYVSKLFITNQPAVGDSYKSFKNKAHQYKIVLVTGEDLHHIGEIVEREAKKPTYPRI